MKTKFKLGFIVLLALLATMAFAVADKYISSSGDLILKTAVNKKVSLNDALYTTQAGNVGAGGVTAPQTKLETTGVLRLQATASPTWPTSGTGLEMASLTSPDLSIIQGYNRTGAVSKDIVLQYSGGNVGINMTPSYRLDVNGDVRFNRIFSTKTGDWNMELTRTETSGGTGFIRFSDGGATLGSIAGNATDNSISLLNVSSQGLTVTSAGDVRGTITKEFGSLQVTRISSGTTGYYYVNTGIACNQLGPYEVSGYIETNTGASFPYGSGFTGSIILAGVYTSSAGFLAKWTTISFHNGTGTTPISAYNLNWYNGGTIGGNAETTLCPTGSETVVLTLTISAVTGANMRGYIRVRRLAGATQDS